jgi:acyl dehydratase
MTTRCFEKLSLGETHRAGPRTVHERAIVEFAERYDPQDLHVDREAAERSLFGGLAASGWHTAAVSMRLLVDEFLNEVAVVGALGVDDLRWRKPVYGGDELTATMTVTKKEPWDEAKGKVVLELVTHNQNGETVHERKDLVLVGRASE